MKKTRKNILGWQYAKQLTYARSTKKAYSQKILLPSYEEIAPKHPRVATPKIANLRQRHPEGTFSENTPAILGRKHAKTS